MPETPRVVLSDEIHCDLTAPGREYIPFASVSEDCRENSVTCLAPTKAFNLAGLQTAAIMVPNEALRNKMHRAINTDEVAEPNAFAVEAAVAAFTKGEAWLDALRAYIEETAGWQSAGWRSGSRSSGWWMGRRPICSGWTAGGSGGRGGACRISAENHRAVCVGGRTVREMRRGVPAPQYRLPQRDAGGRAAAAGNRGADV